MAAPVRTCLVLIALAALGACASFGGDSDAVAPPESPVRLKISAAKLDRLAQIVRLDMPSSDLPREWLDRDSGEVFEMQVLPDAAGMLVIPELAAGESLLLQPVASGKDDAERAGSGVLVRETSDNVVVGVGPREVLAYPTAARAPEGVDPVFTRAAFIHPVYTPGGIVVTDAFPADHLHQNGIWTAWTDTT
ncbi:MAG: DUF6807 family protein, partial [Opitutaceae bacterium]